GYRIVYITAGNGGWRDFDSFLRHLGVHEIIDENAIKARYPEAQSSTWGVPDEFMFRYAEDELKQAKKNNTPVFVMMLSVTNHPPYQLPKPNPTKDFHLTEQEKQRLSSLATGKELNEIFNTFRYSN
ncbi:sulfatase-like hydrolase/transferase, partial [Neisseria sp. P0015.S004]